MYKNIYSTVIKREASLKKIIRECGGEYCVWVGGGVGSRPQAPV